MRTFEVEKKAWVKNETEVLNFLYDKTEYISETIKVDDYYINKDEKDFDVINDPSIRIRKTEDEIKVTFKKQKMVKETEINEEFDFLISDEKTFKSFLEYVGMHHFISKTKTVKQYKYKGANVQYNYVSDLGYFLEIEFLLKENDDLNNHINLIDSIFKEIGIKSEDIEKKYYSELLLEKKK